jgi:ABC-type branched-subunit amino acid transport system permease subunit
VLGSDYRLGLIQSLITAILCLSLVVLTGYAGQVSLAQMAFAGISAFALAKVAAAAGVAFPLTLLIAGAVAIPVGLLVGVPALRVRGINLAIGTLAGGFAVDQFAFNSSSFVGGAAGVHVSKLTLFGLNLDISGKSAFQYPRPEFGIVVVVVLAVIALCVANLRRTATGRQMLAVRSNERAAAAAGVNIGSCKLFAFVISAFIAGIGGGLMAYQIGNLDPSAFDVFTSLTLLAIAFIGGTARIAGALAGGILLATGGLVPTLLQHVVNFGSYQQLVAGILLVASAILYPDGIAATWDAPVAFVRRWLDRVRRPVAAAASTDVGSSSAGTEVGPSNPKVSA